MGDAPLTRTGSDDGPGSRPEAGDAVVSACPSHAESELEGLEDARLRGVGRERRTRAQRRAAHRAHNRRCGEGLRGVVTV
jgi:hypothetical protein